MVMAKATYLFLAAALKLRHLLGNTIQRLEERKTKNTLLAQVSYCTMILQTVSGEQPALSSQ